MRRSSTLSAIALVSAIAITMATGAIAQAVSDAIEEPADAAEMAAAEAAMAPPPAIKKQLHTIPEDGDAAAFDFVPRWLSVLLEARPSEDLIVCIAGCAPHRDRVVYARIKDAPKTASADAAPLAAAPAAAAASKAGQPAFVPTFNLPLENAAEGVQKK